ncbi:MAG: hypothetical protein N2C14_20960, partial [Planctomycetales bacterium]
MGKLDDDATKFLEQRMTEDASLRVRVSAAWALHDKGSPKALPVMLREWKNYSPREEDRHGGRSTFLNRRLTETWSSSSTDERHDDGGGARLLCFLLCAGKKKAIDAIAESYEDLPVDLQMNIAEAGNPPPGWPNEAVDAAETLLMTTLLDTEKNFGVGGSSGGKSWRSPRVCDMAGHALWEKEPEKYPFDIEASRRQRDEQRYKIVNAWRRTKGLPPLKNPVVSRIPKETLKPLLNKASEAEDPDVRRRVLNEIESLGIGALPGVLEAIENCLDPELKADFSATAARLANIVMEIRLIRPSVKPDAKLQTKIDAFKGKPLNSEVLVDFFIGTTGRLPEGSTGMEI